MKNKLPKYISSLIERFPLIQSGRKNANEHSIRIIKTKKLIKEYCENKKNDA
tara:strand:- start:5012 stop:5167 length:156 start_codon:yes stop_codon:yes gene_type:complete